MHLIGSETLRLKVFNRRFAKTTLTQERITVNDQKKSSLELLFLARSPNKEVLLIEPPCRRTFKHLYAPKIEHYTMIFNQTYVETVENLIMTFCDVGI